MSKIIVGVDGSPGSTDAIALASSLAGMTGAELMLVNVFPYDQRPSRAMNAEFEAYLRKDSNELLERLRSDLGDELVEIKAVANPSPAHGLHTLAEQEDAGLIVVGSTHTGRAGRVLPGSTGRAAPARLALPGRRGAEGLHAARRRRAGDRRLWLRRRPVRAARARGRSPHRRGDRGAVARDPRVQADRLRHPTGQRGRGRHRLQRHAARARLRGARRGRDEARRRASRRAVSSPSAIRRRSSSRRPSSSTCCSSARAATVRCARSSSVASPDASCARRPAP